MDAQTFREFGKAAIDFIADYRENIRDCDVLPSVAPGYLLDSLPEQMPEQSQQWQDILEDVNKLIKPGITHWQSPNFHAYYPAGCSYPSMVGDMLATGFSVIGFNWLASPACTELEVVVMDWLAKFFKLPEHFLHSSVGPGGGIIQGSASESILVAIMAAREQAVRRVKAASPHLSEGDIRSRLIAYSSDQSNSCIEKSCILATVPVRLLPADKNQILGGEQLAKAVAEDLAKGLIPTICIATIGTTGTCAHDDIESLASVCESNQIWLHIDAAYAGALLALDDYAHLRRGLDRVDSLNYNLHKSMLINFDCTAMWVRDSNLLAEGCNVKRIYLQTKYEGQRDIPEFRHWQIPLGRRFRALKVWVTFRIYGAEGLRNHIRTHIRLAERFEKHILSDRRFELVAKREMGLVCFRVKGENHLTIDLLQRITERKKIYMVQASFGGKNFLRFAVCGMTPKEEDMDFAWREIEGQLSKLLSEQGKNGVMKTKGLENGVADTNGFENGVADTNGFENGVVKTNGLENGVADTNCLENGVEAEEYQNANTKVQKILLIDDYLDAISQQISSGLQINGTGEKYK